MTERTTDWTAALQAVRASIDELREQLSLPTIDKSFVDAPRAWRRSEDDAAELIPLHALEDILRQLLEAGPKPSQARLDGLYEGLGRGFLESQRILENLATTDPETIAWREHHIKAIDDLRRRARRHDKRLLER